MNETKTESLPAPSSFNKMRSSFVGDVSKLVGGTAFAQALTILVAPILTRLYAPDAFGVAAIFTSITTFIGVVVCLRYELAIMLPETDEDAANLLAVSLCSTVFISGLTAIVVYFASELILRLLNVPDLSPYLWLLPLAVLADGGFLALSYWNTRAKRFERLSIAQVSQSGATSGIQLAVGMVDQLKAGALIWTRVLGSMFGTAILGVKIWQDDQSLFGVHLSLRRMNSLMRRYIKFPLVNMWGALLNTASYTVPPLFLSIYFTKSVVGYFSLSNRLVLLPLTLIGNAIGQVFFQRASKTYSTNGDLAKVVGSVFRRLVNIGLFPAILLTIVGQDLIVVFFGGRWSEAGVYVQILSLGLFFRMVFSPLSTLLAVLERYEATVAVQVVIFLSRLLPFVVGGLMGDARIAMFLYAALGIAVYGGLTIWILSLAGIFTAHTANIILRDAWIYLPLIAVLAVLKLLLELPEVIVVGLSFLSLGVYVILVVYNDLELRLFAAQLFSKAIRRSN